jgi:hypothetical protein
MRKVMAGLAVPRLIAGMHIFIASFFGLTIDKLGPKVFLLHLGIFALFIPFIAVERWSKGADPYRGKPPWVIRSMQILFLLFVVVFFSFLTLSHAASPDVINGKYVLNSDGKIIEHISRQYLFLKGCELRLFASGWILGYYAAMSQSTRLAGETTSTSIMPDWIEGPRTSRNLSGNPNQASRITSGLPVRAQ